MSTTEQTFGDVSLAIDAEHVATVEIHRPPDNYFDVALIRSLAEAYALVDERADSRAIVLCSAGKHFCAGADFRARPAGDRDDDGGGGAGGGSTTLYGEAMRLFRAATPVVAAVQGAAVGGGLGLACSADFRVGCDESRFVANFARLGFHHGFALSVSLPPIVGFQRANELLLTGRRVKGDEAAEIGLVDRLVDHAGVRSAAHELAAEIAASAPLAVASIRQTMRRPLLDQLDGALEREAAEQDRLRSTGDWIEGVRAMAERRPPAFEGR